MAGEQQRIEREAAAWVARSEAGFSSREREEFEAWLQHDSRHAEAYAAIEQSWSRFDGLRGSAMAQRLGRELDDLDATAKTAASRRAKRSRGTPAGVRWVISGALAASVVWALVYFTGWSPALAPRSFAQTVATEIGAVRTMELPDGSLLRLNTNSAVELSFTRGERRVRLARGEAFFTVKKDPARPFVVSAAGVDVRAVGTEFNVRLNEDEIDVVVREGRVRVDDGANGVSLLAPRAGEARAAGKIHEVLAAGHRATIPLSSAPRPLLAAVEPVAVKHEEIARALAWHDRRLVFEAAPLEEIVAEFNRYNRTQLRIEDEQLGHRCFGGTFEATDTRTFLELLRSTEGIVAVRQGELLVLRHGN